MIKRVVEVSTPAKLSLRRGQLLIESSLSGENSIPLEDLGVLVLASSQISVSHAVHVGCAANNCVIIVCDDKHHPSGLYLPLSGNSTSAKFTRQQVTLAPARKNLLWAAIVRQKINEQACTIEHFGADGDQLRVLIPKVSAGDKQNTESQAARLYWSLLFGKGFRRRPDEPGINSLLNYGYSIVRAAVARAVVSSGLCPVFGLHHANPYNHFALVDDLMEPFRPWVDRLVVELVKEGAEEGEQPSIGRPEKEVLLGFLASERRWAGRKEPFMVALQHYVAGARDAICNGRGEMEFIER